MNTSGHASYQSPESLFNTRDIQLFIHNNSLLSNVISYVFLKAQACSETEVVVVDDNFYLFIRIIYNKSFFWCFFNFLCNQSQAWNTALNSKCNCWSWASCQMHLPSSYATFIHQSPDQLLPPTLSSRSRCGNVSHSKCNGWRRWTLLSKTCLYPFSH